MRKRLLCFLLILFVLLVTNNRTYSAPATLDMSQLQQCKKIAAYSGDSAAYFYGFNDNTLFSAQVLPATQARRLTVTGSILAATHDATSAYALCVDKSKYYSVYKLDMQNGYYTQESLEFESGSLYHTLAAAGGELFVMMNGKTHARAVGLRGGERYIYEFTNGIRSIFVNGNSVYAVLNSGEIYRIGSGNMTYCCALNTDESCQSAGVGYVFTDRRRLISLYDGEAQTIDVPFAAKVNGETVRVGSVKLFAAAGNRYAVMQADGSVTVETVSAAAQSNGSLPQMTDGVIRVPAGVTVSIFKKNYPAVGNVYDLQGNPVSAGLLKTGFSAEIDSVRYPVAVLGDITANGKINTSDIKLLMEYFCGDEQFSADMQTAADFNGDGTIDNRDLLLLARSV